MIRALVAEFGKLKRARMLLWTALVVLGYTSIGLATYPVIEDLMANPPSAVPGATDVFARAGITAINWQTGMRFIPMGVSGAWGILLLSLIAAYVFGRELREGADIASATLPIRREAFVTAKMIVIAVWAIALAALSVAAQVGVDLIYLGAAGFEWRFVLKAFADTLYAMLPLYLTLPLIAWLSLTRKGYLRPMLFALAMMVVATGLAGTDAAAYVPWGMPIALVGVTWMPLTVEVGVASWAIALGLFAAGLLAVTRKLSRPAELA